MWKAIASDFDGTLTDERGRLSIESLIAVREAEDNGIPLILASGRELADLRILSRVIGTSGPIIAENGGVVWNPRTLTKRVQGDRTKVLKAYHTLMDHLEQLDPDKPRIRETDVVLRGRKMNELLAILNTEELGVHILDADVATHITDVNTHKGSGLKVAAEMLGIDPSNIVAIGDSENDIALFQAAGASYAVANAYPSLKANATVTMERSFGPGCADAIRRVLEQNSRTPQGQEGDQV